MRKRHRNRYDDRDDRCCKGGFDNRNDSKSDYLRKVSKAEETSNDYPSFMEIIFFIAGVAVTVTLLFAALVLWLGELMGSTALACLIVGAAIAIASIILYFCSLHKALRRISDQLETVYETSRLAKAGYDGIKAWLSDLLGI